LSASVADEETPQRLSIGATVAAITDAMIFTG
jgi:hypothetical protein